MSDPIGKSPGQPVDLNSVGLKNGYTDIPDQSVDAQSDRIIPRQMQSGFLRGTQAVGSQDLVIDSSGKRIGISKLADTENDYAVEMNESGFSISDGTITFISITKDGILLNDGVTDRILLGKDEGGF